MQKRIPSSTPYVVRFLLFTILAHELPAISGEISPNVRIFRRFFSIWAATQSIVILIWGLSLYRVPFFSLERS